MLNYKKNSRVNSLSRKIINEVVSDTRKQKAVAIAVYLKKLCGRGSTIRNYNPYKIQKLTHIHPNTFKSYLPIMVEMGLVRFDGKDNEHLVICRMHSRHGQRNIDIHRFSFKSFKSVYHSLRSFLMLILQQRKDYVYRTLQIARDPKKGQDFNQARKAVKRLVRQGVLKSVYENVKELGMSYKRIAREVGVCVRTAERVVAYALQKRWCSKQTHYERVEMRGVNRMYVQGFTFTTKNYGFIVSANTYTLSKGIRVSLGMV